VPTYEYECPKCKHRFERFQPITDPPVKTCPRCKGRKVRRLISSGAGVIFKGSGFYGTDYRSEAYRKSAKAESSTGGGKESGESKEPKEPKEAKEPRESKEARPKPGKKSEGGKKPS